MQLTSRLVHIIRRKPVSSAILAIFAGLGSKYLLYLLYRKYLSPRKQKSSLKKQRLLNSKFLHQLQPLLKIMVPKFLCRETFLLGIHSTVLICRAFLSIYVAALDGLIAKSIVQMEMKKFAYYLCKWILVALPATFINSAIRFLEKKLSLAFRSRLVHYSLDLYCQNQVYYRVGNFDNRLTNADQCLTDDIATFADSVAKLYGHLTKPILDIILITSTLFGYALQRKSNIYVSPLLAGLVIFSTVRILRALSPKFGRLVAEEAKRKGKLRYAHSRLIANAEEIAFFNGENTEKKLLLEAFENLKMQMELTFKKRFFYVMMEQFFMKYIWSATGMVMVVVPVITAKYANSGQTKTLDEETDRGVGERTRGFETARNLLGSGADAVERLMASYKEIAELSGYTKRVSDMLHVFKDVADGRYSRICQHSDANDDGDKIVQWDTRKVEADRRSIYVLGYAYEVPDFIQFVEVPIITPNGDVICRSIDLMITTDMNVFITGPNGCGKSSMFRILDGLWPCYSGILKKPPKSDLFYIPQRPYMPVGTLRDQVIYPDSRADMVRKNRRDKDLEEVLRIVHLNYIVTREGGWGVASDWSEVLSGGEKQRMALARMFYHKPKFALLDECTSAVSIDVEGQIYQAAKEMGISLLTITHRPSLRKYHSHILTFDGEGGWSFSTMNQGD